MNVDLLERLAETIINWHNNILKVIVDLSPTELRDVVNALHKEAKPIGDRSFSMPIYDQVASIIEAEIHHRYHLQRAKELGAAVYCVAHAGDMTKCAHLHED